MGKYLPVNADMPHRRKLIRKVIACIASYRGGKLSQRHPLWQAVAKLELVSTWERLSGDQRGQLHFPLNLMWRALVKLSLEDVADAEKLAWIIGSILEDIIDGYLVLTHRAVEMAASDGSGLNSMAMLWVEEGKKWARVILAERVK